MFATKLTDIQQEVSHTQLLLRVASAFAFFAALFYVITEIGLARAKCIVHSSQPKKLTR